MKSVYFSDFIFQLKMLFQIKLCALNTIAIQQQQALYHSFSLRLLKST